MNIGGTSYVTHFGIDWPAGTHRVLACLNLAKKWRLFREERGIDVRDPGDRLEEALRLLLPSLKMSPWTVQMIHDFAEHDEYHMLGGAASGKSHAIAACSIAMWITDPLDTAVVISSATLTDLRTRAWSPVTTLFTELKNNRLGFAIPGKLVANQYAIVNEKDEALAATQAARAAIQGRSLDEGRIVGLHVPWVVFMVDELALVRDMDSLQQNIANIRTGTLGFKFCTASNPEPWDHPTSLYYRPPKGVRLTPDTGSWVSARGHFCRHFNGERSPVALDPRLRLDYPFLMTRENIAATLADCDGSRDHPRYMRMVVGFPSENVTRDPVVLDPATARANRITEAMPPPLGGGARRRIALCAGVDPAYSEGGDDAVYAGAEVAEQDGRVWLDFGGRVSRLPLSSASPLPVSRQLLDGVVGRLRSDGGPQIGALYADSSGNQSLADLVDMLVAPGCGRVNSSARASDRPVRCHDSRPAREHIRDRGTEAWVVLAAFCEAGMVRGLPQAAADGLTTRRFVMKADGEVQMPLRLEPKDSFSKRFKGSPNDTDACALAALAAKEVLAVSPFGYLPPPVQSAVAPGTSAAPACTNATACEEDYGSSGDDGFFDYGVD